MTDAKPLRLVGANAEILYDVEFIGTSMHHATKRIFVVSIKKKQPA